MHPTPAGDDREAMRRDFLGLLAERAAAPGPLPRVRLGAMSAVLVARPELVREVLVERLACLGKDRECHSLLEQPVNTCEKHIHLALGRVRFARGDWLCHGAADHPISIVRKDNIQLGFNREGIGGHLCVAEAAPELSTLLGGATARPLAACAQQRRCR